MSFETKALVSAMLQILADSKDIKDAYRKMARIASADGMTIPTYEEAKAKLKED